MKTVKKENRIPTQKIDSLIMFGIILNLFDILTLPDSDPGKSLLLGDFYPRV